ncbi:MAG: helix-turn-helix domain-containing protein [Verrucomicrobiota bacterium]|nr:helix-turn-helix domain-containing protein [Verrucomicrobiota bacterium]
MEKHISLPNLQNHTGSDIGLSGLWTIDQLASYLCISKRTTRNLLNRGLLPVIKISNKIQRFRKEAIDEALAKQEIKARFDRISRGGRR